MRVPPTRLPAEEWDPARRCDGAGGRRQPAQWPADLPEAALQQADAAARELPEVMECYLMSGDHDYLLRVIVADARDYERLPSPHLTRLPKVDRVRSSFALRTVVKKTAIEPKPEA